MRKIFLLFIPILLFISHSCEDFLNKESYTDHEMDILKTKEGLNGMLNGIYDLYSDNDYYGRTIYAYEGAKGPDFFVRLSSGGSFERENRYAESTTSSGSARSSWLKIYSVIRNATTLLEYIHEVPDLSEEEKRTIQGEAVALRGLAYFDLMRLFAYPPLYSIPGQQKYDEKYKWGMPHITDFDMINNIFKYEVRRETAEDTFNYIEKHLIAAQHYLKGLRPKERRINYVAVSALLTRFYIYMNQWEDAIEAGEETLRAANGIYSLIPYDNYKTTYYKSFNTENIWELIYSTSDNLGSNSLNTLVRKPTFNNPGADNDGKVSENIGYAAYGLSTYAIDVLTSHPNDVRSYLICDLGIANKDYKGYRKYVGEQYHYVYNLPVVKLPEVYLSLAEAYLEGRDDIVKAEEYYNYLREARTKTSGFQGNTVDECIDEVLEERRRELMLEGHTYWDYFRKNREVIRQLVENSNKSRILFNGSRSQFVYPIPLQELEANKAIRDQQNNLYESYNQVHKDNN